jgi:hypothetical protein
MIRPLIVGFEVIGGDGASLGKVLSFAEAVELQSQVTDAPAEIREPIDRVDIERGAGFTMIYPSRMKQAKSNSSSAISAKNPWESESLAVPIEQAAEFTEAARKFAGPGVSYEPDGKGYAKLRCESKGARNRALQWLGKVDRDGGFGDYTGR